MESDKTSCHENEQTTELVFTPLPRGDDGVYHVPVSNIIRMWRGQPVIIDNYPPMRIGGEIVTHSVDYGADRVDGNKVSVFATQKSWSGTSPTFRGEWLRSQPVFPTKPDKQFPTCNPHRETLPFQPASAVDDTHQLNLIHESERRKAIATALARIVIRVQQKESKNDSD